MSARDQWPRVLLPCLIALVAGLLGYLLVRGVAEPVDVASSPARTPARTPRLEHVAPGPTKAAARDSFPDGTTIELFSSSREHELVLRFPSAGSYTSFTRALELSPVRLLGRLDRLRALRVGADDQEMEHLYQLFQDEQITSYKTLTSLPEPPVATGGIKEQAASFGDQVLPWLGVTGDNSRWGQGVKVAVIDTGVSPHRAIPRIYQSIEIVPFPEDLAATQWHGTAVASMIAGAHPMVRGVAPAVDLISVRVCDERGLSDAYFVAAGMLAAMDAGADIINLSLGSSQASPLEEEALRLVQEHGVIVVASSGNSGTVEAKYPAAHPGVIGVGAVDASGERMSFSNLGTALGMTAPGYGVNAAGPGDGFIRISGTSASAPLVSGAIAATMSDGSGRRVSAADAVRIVMDYADDEGPPGFDAEYGVGVLNLGRIMNRAVPGITDAAVTWQQYIPASGGRPAQLQVTVQNRGTAALINTRVEVTTRTSTAAAVATTIAPGVSETLSISIQPVESPGQRYASVTTTVSPGNAAADLTPLNNRRKDIILLK